MVGKFRISNEAATASLKVLTRLMSRERLNNIKFEPGTTGIPTAIPNYCVCGGD
jgi:hypothetical protein